MIRNDFKNKVIILVFIILSVVSCSSGQTSFENLPSINQFGGTEVGNPPSPIHDSQLRTVRGFLEKDSQGCIADTIIFTNDEGQVFENQIDENCHFEVHLKIDKNYQISFKKRDKEIGDVWFLDHQNRMTNEFTISESKIDIDLGVIQFVEDHFVSQFNPLAQNDSDQNGISDFEDDQYAVKIISQPEPESEPDVQPEDVQPEPVVELAPEPAVDPEPEPEPQPEPELVVEPAEPAVEPQPEPLQQAELDAIDRDQDGVDDDDDNCPFISNPDQEDRDQDGQGDHCEDQLFTGAYSSCLLNLDGELRCWGENGAGQLGQNHRGDIGDDPNEMGDNLLPIRFNEGENQIVQQVSLGLMNTCVLFDSNEVKCWGSSFFGMLGNEGRLEEAYEVNIGDQREEMVDFLFPIDLGTDENITQVKVDDYLTCVQFESGRMKCWGDDPLVRYLVSLDRIAGIMEGEMEVNGDVEARGSVGDDPGEMGMNLPYINLGENLTIRDFAMDRGQTCAVLSDDGIKCWGSRIGGDFDAVETIGDDEFGDNIPYISDEVIEDPIAHMTLRDEYLFFKLQNGSIKIFNVLDGSTISYEGEYIRNLYLNGPVEEWEPDIEIGPMFNFGLALVEGGVKQVTFVDNEDPEIRLSDEFIDTGTNLEVISLSEGTNDHICMMFSDQSVKCIYTNDRGQLGLGLQDDVFILDLADSPFLNL